MDSGCMPGAGVVVIAQQAQLQESPPFLISSASTSYYTEDHTLGTTCTCTCTCPGSPSAQSPALQYPSPGPFPPFLAPSAPGSLVPATPAPAAPGSQRLHELLLEATASAAVRKGQKRSSNSREGSSSNSDNGSSAGGSACTSSSGSSHEGADFPAKKRIETEEGFGSADQANTTSRPPNADTFFALAQQEPGQNPSSEGPYPTEEALHGPGACKALAQLEQWPAASEAVASLVAGGPSPPSEVTQVRVEAQAEGSTRPHAGGRAIGRGIAAPRGAPNLPVPRSFAERFLARMAGAKLQGGNAAALPTPPAWELATHGMTAQPLGLLSSKEVNAGPVVPQSVAKCEEEAMEVTIPRVSPLRGAADGALPSPKNVVRPLPPSNLSSTNCNAPGQAPAIPSRILPPRPAPQAFFTLPQGLSPAALLGSPSPVLLRSASLPSPSTAAAASAAPAAAVSASVPPSATLKDPRQGASSGASPVAGERGSPGVAGVHVGPYPPSDPEMLLPSSLPNSPGVLFMGGMGASSGPLARQAAPPMSPLSPFAAFSKAIDSLQDEKERDEVATEQAQARLGGEGGRDAGQPLLSPKQEQEAIVEEQPCSRNSGTSQVEAEAAAPAAATAAPAACPIPNTALHVESGHELEKGGSHDVLLPGLVDDGYNWRKYGQKQVKACERPRSYYKCSVPGCPARKKVELDGDGQSWVECSRSGSHNHPPPSLQRRPSSGEGNETALAGQAPQEALAFAAAGAAVGLSCSAQEVSACSSGMDDEDDEEGDDEEMGGGAAVPRAVEFKDMEASCDARASVGLPASAGVGVVNAAVGRKRDSAEAAVNGPTGKKRRPLPFCGQRKLRDSKFVIEADSAVELLDDGYRWRKYGQKIVKGHLNPRSYYKCTSLGCPVRKHVERSEADPRKVVTTYEGRHNHEVPNLMPCRAVLAAGQQALEGTAEEAGLPSLGPTGSSLFSAPSLGASAAVSSGPTPSSLSPVCMEESHISHDSDIARQEPSTVVGTSHAGSAVVATAPRAVPPSYGKAHTGSEIQAQDSSNLFALLASQLSQEAFSLPAEQMAPGSRTPAYERRPDASPVTPQSMSFPSPAVADLQNPSDEVVKHVASLLEAHRSAAGRRGTHGSGVALSHVAASAAAVMAAAAAAASGAPLEQGSTGVNAIQLLASAVSAAEQCLSVLAPVQDVQPSRAVQTAGPVQPAGASPALAAFSLSLSQTQPTANAFTRGPADLQGSRGFEHMHSPLGPGFSPASERAHPRHTATHGPSGGPQAHASTASQTYYAGQVQQLGQWSQSPTDSHGHPRPT